MKRAAAFPLLQRHAGFRHDELQSVDDGIDQAGTDRMIQRR